MTTITLWEAGGILIGLAIFVLLVHCIVLVINVTRTLRSTNKILNDVEVISSAAARTTKEAEKAAGELSKSVSGLANAIKGNQSVIAAITAIINACISLRNLLAKTDN